MDHYQKVKSVDKKRDSREPWDIYVSQGCKLRYVIQHCLKMLGKRDDIVLTGVGAQVSKTITIAEIVKRRTENLYQNTEIYYTNFEDTWEPKDEHKDLDTLKVTRNLPTIKITLSKSKLDSSSSGYQGPAGLTKEVASSLQKELYSTLNQLDNGQNTQTDEKKSKTN